MKWRSCFTIQSHRFFFKQFLFPYTELVVKKLANLVSMAMVRDSLNKFDSNNDASNECENERIFLNLLEFTWICLNLLEFTWIYLNLLEFTWIYLNLLEFTWIRRFEKKTPYRWTDGWTDWWTDQRMDGRTKALFFKTKNSSKFK